MASSAPRDDSSRHSYQYFRLPFNPKLRDQAKELRKAGVLSEVLLWNQLKHGKFNGLDFDRQKIVGNYIVDFFCARHGAVIEVDGVTHNTKQSYDIRRDAYLEGLGLTVIHILADDVLHDLDAVMQMLSCHPVFEDCLGLFRLAEDG